MISFPHWTILTCPIHCVNPRFIHLKHSSPSKNLINETRKCFFSQPKTTRNLIERLRYRTDWPICVACVRLFFLYNFPFSLFHSRCSHCVKMSTVIRFTTRHMIVSVFSFYTFWLNATACAPISTLALTHTEKWCHTTKIVLHTISKHFMWRKQNIHRGEWLNYEFQVTECTLTRTHQHKHSECFSQC